MVHERLDHTMRLIYIPGYRLLLDYYPDRVVKNGSKDVSEQSGFIGLKLEVVFAEHIKGAQEMCLPSEMRPISRVVDLVEEP